jgi:hypothetical protein
MSVTFQAPTDPPADEPWAFAKRLSFRFAFVLFPLLCLLSPLESVPSFDTAAAAWLRAKCALGVWVAVHVLRVPVETSSTGFGVVGWLLVGMQIAGAALASAVWTALDRRPRSHRRLLEGLRVYLRFTLCAVMLVYGFAKVYCVQFPAPTNVTLSRMIGEVSPSDFLWTFMGVSRGYQLFGGIPEVVGAALLVFRRTTTLGALILAGVLANVVALNVFYDVNVKIWSTTLLATAAFLVLPDAARLTRALLFLAAVPAKRDVSLLTSTRGHLAARIGQVVFVVGVAVPIGWRAFEKSRSRTVETAGPLAGFYAAAGPCNDTSASHQWIALDVTGAYFQVLRADRRTARYSLPTYDAAAKTLTVFDRAHNATYRLTADLNGSELRLSGEVEGEAVDARLIRTEPPKFALTSHATHW